MFSRECNPRRRIISEPDAAAKGPAMAAPNRKPLPANDNNRRALGDIGNLVGALNGKCNINKDGVTERPRVNLVVNANKEASSSTQQFQAEDIVAREEGNTEAGVVCGNKQRHTIRREAQYATATQKDTVISVNDSKDSTAQDGGLRRPSQLKARKPMVQSLTAMLTAQSEVCRIALSAITSLILLLFSTGSNPNVPEPKNACRDFHKLLPSIDDGDLESQLEVVDYVEDIYNFYRNIETISCIPPDYMTRQVEINEKMRAILIDWLIEVHLKFELMPETLYLTLNIIDRYLSVHTTTRRELQLVGITAMLIACKYEEIWPPKINDFVCILPRECTSEHIVAMEHTILNQLKFNLTVPTPYVFLVRFLKAAGPDKVMENLAFFLAELCLLHYIMIKYSPSKLAAAAVYTAQCTLKKDPCWSKKLTLFTGYSEADLKECAHFMVNIHLNARGNELRVVHKKYSVPFFGCVAFLGPAKLPAEDSCSSNNYTVIAIGDSIDLCTQESRLKTPCQLKARKPRTQSMSATLAMQSEDACRDSYEVLPSIDDGDLENQLAVVEYVEDIYKFYRKIETISCVPPDYMTRQVEINEKMRAVLIDWLIKVHLKSELMPETLYLTLNIIDRYLSTETVTKRKLQLVGITAMLIACKYEELWPPKVNDLVRILPKEYTSEQIVAMEHTILNQLKFNLTVPTPYVFLIRFLKAAGSGKVMENLALFLVELCLLHYIMIKYSPSMLAAAAVYTAQCTLKKDPCWSKTLILHTGYFEADLKECAQFMVNFHLNARRNKLRVVHDKYSAPFFSCVAFLSPANLPAADSCSSSN